MKQHGIVWEYNSQEYFYSYPFKMKYLILLSFEFHFLIPYKEQLYCLYYVS